MEFEDAYKAFMDEHMKRRTGSNVERIKSGLQHAELEFLREVWWPGFQNFDHLYPEYEIRDYHQGKRYIDFAYIRRNFRIAIEIDGIGPHWKDITQEKFADHNLRQNHLVIDHWHVLRFAYHSIRTAPRVCQQTIQQLLGRLSINSDDPLRTLNALQQGIMRLAYSLDGFIKPSDVMYQFNVTRQTAERQLRLLAEAGWLERATSATKRTYAYYVHPSHI